MNIQINAIQSYQLLLISVVLILNYSLIKNNKEVNLS